MVLKGSVWERIFLTAYYPQFAFGNWHEAMLLIDFNS